MIDLRVIRDYVTVHHGPKGDMVAVEKGSRSHHLFTGLLSAHSLLSPLLRRPLSPS